MRIIIHYLLIIISSVSLVVFTCTQARAREAKSIEVTYEQQVYLNIANGAINRINFDNQIVVKIIGNINSFTSILSDNGTDLFITPKLPEGNKIDFSVLLASGDIIDFSLNIVGSQIPYLASLKFPSNTSNSYKSEAAQMIEAMRHNVTGKYYVQQSRNKISIVAIPDIKAVTHDSYRFGKLYGISLILHNTNHFRSIEITEEQIGAEFSNIVAIHLENKILAPNSKGAAYIVFKRREV